MTGMMHDGICSPLTRINMNSIHHTQTQPLFYLSFIQALCQTSFFPSLSLNQKKRHCLSLPLVFCVHADKHRHTHTQIQYVRRHRNTCTHRERHAHTHTACLLLLRWLRAVKTSLLFLPLSHQSSLTELVYAGSQRLLSIRPHSLFLPSPSLLHICASQHLDFAFSTFSQRASPSFAYTSICIQYTI